MHYLQVSGHSSLKTVIQMCPVFSPWGESGQVGRGRGGGRREGEGARHARLMWMLLMSTRGCVTFARHALYLSLSVSVSLSPLHPVKGTWRAEVYRYSETKGYTGEKYGGGKKRPGKVKLI